jgi:glycerol-3-phosphate acyltransferase PlsY
MPVNEALLHNWFYGNYGVRLAAAVVFAFLMGSLPIGPVVAWLFADLDPRLRRAAAAAVAPLNALKGFVPTAIALHGGGPAVGLYAAAAATAGHCFCPWRRFRGGTGCDLVAGVALALSPPAALVVVALWAAAALSSRSVQAGSLFACALLFLPLWYFVGAEAALFGIAAAAALVLRLRIGDQALERG